MRQEEHQLGTEILKMLRETEEYVSGQQISERLGVSRTAVWKVIRRLREEGYEVEAVRNRGYRIIGSADVLNREALASLMRTGWAGRSLHYYEETDSTNLRIRSLADEGAPHGTLAVAGSQTAGRGRRGRSWSSPGGENVYMSVLLRPQIPPERAPMLTLVMALSVAGAIRKVAGLPVQIKWPNDIICGGRKLVGILTEMSAQVDYINYVTVGVGINVNQTVFPEEIRDTASSLAIECGHPVQRAPLVAAVMEGLEEDYGTFLETMDLSGLAGRYESLLVNKDREVRILSAKGDWQGHALGITPTGELIVRRGDGTVEEVFSGEVSVRGVYGYV